MSKVSKLGDTGVVPKKKLKVNEKQDGCIAQVLTWKYGLKYTQKVLISGYIRKNLNIFIKVYLVPLIYKYFNVCILSI